MKDLAKYALVLTLSIGFVGCGDDKKTDEKNNGKSGVTIDQSSPKKVAESFQKALKAKDWKNAFACVTEESRKELALAAKRDADDSAFGDEAKKKSLAKIFKKHGIDDKKTGPFGNPVANVKDKPALFGDLAHWVEKNGTAKEKRVIQQWASTEFSNFQTDGDKAAADTNMGGQKEQTPVAFKKIDGKWFLGISRITLGKRRGSPPFPKKT